PYPSRDKIITRGRRLVPSCPIRAVPRGGRIVMGYALRRFAGVRTFGLPPRGADLRPFPWANLGSTASRFSVRRGTAEAAAWRQAGWWADWRDAHRRSMR